jgi:integrase
MDERAEIMAKRRKKQSQKQPLPKVRIACPEGRPFQLRYICPIEKREVRVSTGTRDRQEAEQQKRELEARLLLGIATKKQERQKFGPEMDWEEFREFFRTLHLSTIRHRSALHAESRLDLAERILRPRCLGDVADATAMQKLQANLLKGVESRRGKPRSAHTVKGYLNSVLSAINWAYLQGWLPAPIRFRKLKVGKLKTMKGRPITATEFERMLQAVPAVVGEAAAPSWKYVLRGLWESALRIDELMHVSWNLPGTIRPVWGKEALPLLVIPSSMQKNNTEEDIPLLPDFESMLLETEPGQRNGWVFNPQSVQSRFGKTDLAARPETEWVGKVIAKIGKKADVIVDTADPVTGRPVKYASAHDLRRSCGERLRNAGVPPLVICRVMRHASWETTRKHYAPGDVQRDAEVLKHCLRDQTKVAPAAKEAGSDDKPS